MGDLAVSHSQQDSLLFERFKNVILAESPTLRLFKAIERDNFEGIKQALASGALVCPSWDENALTSRVNKLISMNDNDATDPIAIYLITSYPYLVSDTLLQDLTMNGMCSLLTFIFDFFDERDNWSS